MKFNFKKAFMLGFIIPIIVGMLFVIGYFIYIGFITNPIITSATGIIFLVAFIIGGLKK